MINVTEFNEIASIYKKIEISRKGGRVRRFHTEPFIGEQNNAHHSHGVALIVHYLHPDASKDLIIAALTHDIEEGYLGDMPGQVKHFHKPLKKAMNDAEKKYRKLHGLDIKLSKKEQVILKWADTIELLFTCYDQAKLGNRNVSSIVDNLVKMAVDYPPIHRATKLFSMLEKGTRRYCNL